MFTIFPLMVLNVPGSNIVLCPQVQSTVAKIGWFFQMQQAKSFLLPTILKKMSENCYLFIFLGIIIAITNNS
jgi:hypothetical protein